MIDVCNILIKEMDGYRGGRWWERDMAEAETVWQLRGPQAMRRQFDAKSKLARHSILRTCTRDSDRCRAFYATCRFGAWYL